MPVLSADAARFPSVDPREFNTMARQGEAHQLMLFYALGPLLSGFSV
jgi:hypothetical protein